MSGWIDQGWSDEQDAAPMGTIGEFASIADQDGGVLVGNPIELVRVDDLLHHLLGALWSRVWLLCCTSARRLEPDHRQRESAGLGLEGWQEVERQIFRSWGSVG